MTVFPTPYVVDVLPYSEGPERDGRGALSKSWGEPFPQRAIGWGAPRSAEPKLAGHNRVVVDTELYVPPGFVCKPHDRVVTPDRVVWQVVGEIETYAHGPFGFNPGGVVNLKRVEG